MNVFIQVDESIMSDERFCTRDFRMLSVSPSFILITVALNLSNVIGQEQDFKPSAQEIFGYSWSRSM